MNEDDIEVKSALMGSTGVDTTENLVETMASKKPHAWSPFASVILGIFAVAWSFARVPADYLFSRLVPSVTYDDGSSGALSAVADLGFDCTKLSYYDIYSS